MGGEKNTREFKVSLVFVMVWINLVGLSIFWTINNFMSLDKYFHVKFLFDVDVVVPLVSCALFYAALGVDKSGHAKKHYSVVVYWSLINFIIATTWAYYDLQHMIKGAPLWQHVGFMVAAVVWFILTAKFMANILKTKTSRVFATNLFCGVFIRTYIFMSLEQHVEPRYYGMLVGAALMASLLAYVFFRVHDESPAAFKT